MSKKQILLLLDHVIRDITSTEASHVNAIKRFNAVTYRGMCQVIEAQSATLPPAQWDELETLRCLTREYYMKYYGVPPMTSSWWAFKDSYCTTITTVEEWFEVHNKPKGAIVGVEYWYERRIVFLKRLRKEIREWWQPLSLQQSILLYNNQKYIIHDVASPVGCNKCAFYSTDHCSTMTNNCVCVYVDGNTLVNKYMTKSRTTKLPTIVI